MEELKTNKRLLILSLLLATLIFIIDVKIPLGVAGGVPYILLVLISLWFPRIRFTLFMAILGSLLTIAGFFLSPSGGELWKVLANRFLALFAIWVTTILTIHRKRSEEVAKQKAKLIQLMQEVVKAANEALTVDDAMKVCLDKVCAYTGWPVGHVYLCEDEGRLLPTKIWHSEDRGKFRNFIVITEGTVFKKGEGLPGRVLQDGKPHWIEDVTIDKNFPRAKKAKNLGVKGAFAFPVLEGKEVVAVLEFFIETIERPDETIIETITNIGIQLSHVTERKRLEDALHKSKEDIEKRYEDTCSILNELRIGAVITKGDGIVTYVNATFEKFLGKPFSKAVGIHWEDLLTFAEQEKKLIASMHDSPSNKRFKVYFKIRNPSGREFRMEIEIKDDPRNIDGRILLFYDITELYELKRKLDEQVQFRELIGTSEPMIDLRMQIKEISKLNWTVLLKGETGTGKELVAKAIHFSSNRRDKPFIAVNTAGLSESLLTSQLFGHKKGAFTDAVEDHKGLFESANGGTLYLDEIGDISPSVQISLLRVMEEQTVVRLGETKERKVDVRIITATHRDLDEEVSQGRFREDLLYRIRIARIGLPPLRELREDIPLLAEHFLEESKAVTGKKLQGFSIDAMRSLIKFGWPGNVRELKSAIGYSLIHCKGLVINQDDLPPEILDFVKSKPKLAEKPDTINLDIKEAIKFSGGNRTRAAKLLGISRATLYRHLSREKP